MAEIPAHAFLGPQQRSSKRCCCLIPDKYLVFALALSFFTFIVGAVYVTTVGIEPRLLLPKRSAVVPVPPSWLSRAIIYNTRNQLVALDGSDTPPKPLSVEPPDYKLVCYYSFPADGFREGRSATVLKAINLDANLCTHLNVGFARIVNGSVYLDDYQTEVSGKVVRLKETNPRLKVLLSIGGAGNTDGFAQMVTDHSKRKKFIRSVVETVKTERFDGVDLDWEFPGKDPGHDGRQKMHFTQLLREIREEIDRQERHKFLLSVAVAAPTYMIDQSYDVAYMNEYVDYVNLMSYDYHFFTKYTPFTGLNAPLYHLPQEDGTYFATLNINASAHYWTEKGMDRRKIIVGLPTYGHSFRLQNPLNNGLNAPAAGYGLLGQDGFADYAQVCWFLSKNQIKPVWVPGTYSPYATHFHEWVSYDDNDSLTYKVHFVRDHHYGGVMVLSLNTDDHRGACKIEQGEQPVSFPLTRGIREALLGADG